MIIIKNYMCWAGVWSDSEPMEWTPEIQQVFDKMQKNFRRGLVEREPKMIWLNKE